MAGIKQPSDKSHFLLPDLGEGLAEAELIDWKVKAGDTVKESQTLAEMQTDKALVEVPSPWAGTLTEICGKAGDIIKVGAVLVRYVPAGAAAKSAPSTSGSSSAAAKPAASASSNGSSQTASSCISGQVAAGAPAAADDQGTVVGTMSGTLTVSDRFARRASEVAVVSREGKALATP
ncbi:MAG: hypothetical protein EBR07_09850, partial [Planctomycetes bacterium]|nr:hypothetical protein [Planctomycetota bacterium]